MTNPKDQLLYWIRERWDIKEAKDAGVEKPWSRDWVFQETFFCNVRREDDKVSKWIRENWSPKQIGLVNYEFCMILARFLNWPATLAEITDPIIRARPDSGMDSFADEWFGVLERRLMELSHVGKVWGNAYVITTHGIPMGKVQYLVENVLRGAYRSLQALREACGGPYLRDGYLALKQLEGLGSFLAAQVIADLKNTPEHPLSAAKDWWTFVAPGPGSLRGASWFHYGDPTRVTPRLFDELFMDIREYVDDRWPLDVPKICNQDLQNCLCEYDKYMRVLNKTGRSKRGYDGGH